MNEEWRRAEGEGKIGAEEHEVDSEGEWALVREEESKAER